MKTGRISRFLCIAAWATVCGYGASFSKCDVNQSGTTGVGDVQQVVMEALGGAQALDDLNNDHVVNVVDVEIDINAALGYSCAADPGLVSLLPSSAAPGATGVNITITGRLTSFNNGSNISLGAGISVTNVVAVSATLLTATIAVDANAATGIRDLNVDGLTLTMAFTVAPPASVSYTYDTQGRLSTTTYTSSIGAVTVVTYTYDASGNRISVITR